jgi:hypothetical protein
MIITKSNCQKLGIFLFLLLVCPWGASANPLLFVHKNKEWLGFGAGKAIEIIKKVKEFTKYILNIASFKKLDIEYLCFVMGV